jgi:hypothetical protein
MHMIRSAEALSRLATTHDDDTLRHLLAAQAENLADYDLEDVATLLVVEPQDTCAALDEVLSWPLLTDDHFTHYPELLNRSGTWYEATFILSDFGEGLVLYVPEDGPAALLDACKAEATR